MTVGFGALLRDFRLKAGWTQEDLAERSGVSMHAISVLEAGRRTPRISSVSRLAAALGLDDASREQLVAALRAPTTTTADAPAATTEPARVVPRLLPYDVADFTGRSQALADLTEQMVGGHRPGMVVISTIAGMGGIGKSTLAVHVAHRCLADFPDGQLYVELRGATNPRDPGEVLTDLLRELGVPPQQVPPQPEARAALYRSTLAGRRVLLVLDDAKDAAQVRPLLPGTPGCGVLITSRSRLATLAGAARLDLDVFSPAEALELFTTLVGAERVAAELVAASRILDQCAGLPLAIRIAGARLASRPAWSLSSLADRLAGARPLDELAIEDAAVRASFRVSYDTLNSSTAPADRAAARAFRLLGLWGGADLALEAAAALLGCSVDEADRALEALVDAHLLDSPAMGRYRLHDLLRAYAGECAEAEEAQQDRWAAGERLASWYLHAVTAAADWFNDQRVRPDLTVFPAPAALPTQADRAAAIAWARQERPNFTAAATLAGAQPEPVIAWRLGAELFHIFSQTGYWDDLEACDTVGLRAARQLGDRVAQARMLVGLSSADRLAGRLEESLVKAREAYELAEDGTSDYTHFTTMIHYASSLHCLERYEEAIAAYEHAFATRRGEVRPGVLAAAMNNLGYAYHKLGRHQDAIECYLPALALSRQAQSAYVDAALLDGLGRAHLGAGEFDRAVERFDEAVLLRTRLGDQAGLGSTLEQLGDTHRAADRPEQAREAWTRALHVLEAARHPGAEAVRAKLI
ncbi:tetratricopeptide repeat protein [Kitasatospora sp. MMS16-BH015]|uniref:ATP-binding protein n=1 Tax=Kitasatospora sp. MMS16-BH015 TaxID=2018025 RepID=UPI00131A4E6D|nr:helix-turn-helix domain-containing protein [Kitasatospora sp. MMS16-BH015]